VSTAAEAAAGRERPAGVTVIAVAVLLASAYLAALAALVVGGRAPLMRGAYLLEGLELLGPAVFAATALLAGAAGAGLLLLRNWARRLTLLLIVGLAAGAVPAVSSAVIDFRFFTLAREGIKVIGGVVAWFYLSQPDTRAAFQK
jgi:hypothetical protein